MVSGRPFGGSSLLSYFDKAKLDKMQESLSRVTGLAFSTVNYRGEALTDLTGFSSFCGWVRNNPALAEACRGSDAMGAIQAALAGKPFLYLCPCGLMEIAVPIIVDGVYLGGFLCGQARCPDPPENIVRMRLPENAEAFLQAMEETRNLRKNLPVLSHARMEEIADLTALFVAMLTENGEHRTDRETTAERQTGPDSLRGQVLILTEILEAREYGRLRDTAQLLAGQLCAAYAGNPTACMDAFRRLAEDVEKCILPDDSSVSELSPTSPRNIGDEIPMALWLHKIMDGLFRKNAVRQHKILDGVFTYIGEHLSEQITLDRLVRECGISQGYLSRLFRASFGCSVMDYLHMRKILAAKEMMCADGCNGQDAAFRLGYRESSHFSRVFKKYENMTLKDYKRRLKQQPRRG